MPQVPCQNHPGRLTAQVQAIERSPRPDILHGTASHHDIPVMIQRVESPDATAVDASNRIAEAARAWRVVLFGRRARNARDACA